MNRWAKIIEVLDNQVLFFMEPEDNCESLHQVVRINGLLADVKIGGISIEDCEKVFNSIDEKAAETVIKTLEDLLENK